MPGCMQLRSYVEGHGTAGAPILITPGEAMRAPGVMLVMRPGRRRSRRLLGGARARHRGCMSLALIWRRRWPWIMRTGASEPALPHRWEGLLPSIQARRRHFGKASRERDKIPSYLTHRPPIARLARINRSCARCDWPILQRSLISENTVLPRRPVFEAPRSHPKAGQDDHILILQAATYRSPMILRVSEPAPAPQTWRIAAAASGCGADRQPFRAPRNWRTKAQASRHKEPAPVYIGLDFGTSGARAIAIDGMVPA